MSGSLGRAGPAPPGRAPRWPRLRGRDCGGLRLAELAGQTDEELLREVRELAQERTEHPDPEHRDSDVRARDHSRAARRAVEDRELAEVRAFADSVHLGAVAHDDRFPVE